MYAISKNLPQIVRDGITFKFDNCEPSEFAKDVARHELRETPENVENGLKELRRLLKEEQRLHCPIDNDIWLMSFLRPAHFHAEDARRRIRNYYNYRTKYPELYKDLTLESIKDIMHATSGSIQPQRDQCGRRIHISLGGKYWDTKKFEKELLLKLLILNSEFVRTESETQICGIIIILDMLDLSLRQALLYTPGFLKRLVEFIQDGMGLRFKAYHIVNQPKIFDMVFALAKPFIREKFVQLAFFHGKDMTSLHRHVSPDCLPEYYGGTLKTKITYGPEYYEICEKFKEDFNRYMTYGYIS